MNLYEMRYHCTVCQFDMAGSIKMSDPKKVKKVLKQNMNSAPPVANHAKLKHKVEITLKDYGEGIEI